MGGGKKTDHSVMTAKCMHKVVHSQQHMHVQCVCIHTHMPNRHNKHVRYINIPM